MTNNSQVLPVDYVPYDKINLCGNSLTKVNYLFADGNYYPILIGKGIIPKIWLYNRHNDGAVSLLVDKSNSYFPQILAYIDPDARFIKIAFVQNAAAINMFEITQVLQWWF